MFRNLFKSMSSFLDDLKEGDVEFTDVTTDEGINKVRDAIYNMKGGIKNLKENLKDSWFSCFLDKNELDNFETSLDEVLEDAEEKYQRAHENASEDIKYTPGDIEEKCPCTDENTTEDTESDYTRPVLFLTNEDASNVYDIVDKYLEEEICPRLPEDTTPEFVQSIKESFVDFAAWIINKY